MSRSSRDMVEDILENLTIRARSLIVTTWGDTIRPLGDGMWLGSVIRLLAPLGLNERVIRTSVFRLQKDEWLKSRQKGRRSFYSLTDNGERRTDAADQRIYRVAAPGWSGKWLMLVAGDLTIAERDALRHDLMLQGFGSPAAGVFAAPTPDWKEVESLLDEHDLRDRVAVFHADHADAASPQALRSMVANAWDLSQLAESYSGFVDQFAPIAERLTAGGQCDGETAFMLRTLLVHDFRRIILRDPMLPDPLLPTDWSGHRARNLIRTTYGLIHDRAMGHAQKILQSEAGPLPSAAETYYDRFGGLPR